MTSDDIWFLMLPNNLSHQLLVNVEIKNNGEEGAMNKRSLSKMIGLVFLTAILVVFIAFPSIAQDRFYVCLVNDTNHTIYYSAEWCTRAGYDCTGFRSWSIAPGYTRRHWVDGRGKMIVRMHTGGSGGIIKTYYLYGTTGRCRASSTSYIRYNDRGFLRIYAY